MTITGIDHVQVAGPPGCEDDARAFYGGLLGMAEVPKPEQLRASGGCWFRAGAQEVHVGVEDRFVPARKAHPGLVSDDLEALRSRLDAAGVVTEPDERIPGTARFYADDPFGNRLEFRNRI
jgi:catechol 2,3-dioxygenase-like lactoylglutathione lyase family enzyme